MSLLKESLTDKKGKRGRKGSKRGKTASYKLLVIHAIISYSHVVDLTIAPFLVSQHGMFGISRFITILGFL